MSRSNRKGKKVQTGVKSSDVVGQDTSSGVDKKITLPPGTGKLQPDRTVLATKEIHITAPIKSCFKIIARQLEQAPRWDPVIIDAEPVSNARGKIGATSHVILNLGGKNLASPAVICRYQSNRAISWVLNNKHKVREDWSLKAKGAGTLVQLTLTREVPGWIMGRLLYKSTRWKKVEQDLETTVTLLKEHVEMNHRS